MINKEVIVNDTEEETDKVEADADDAQRQVREKENMMHLRLKLKAAKGRVTKVWNRIKSVVENFKKYGRRRRIFQKIQRLLKEQTRIFNESNRKGYRKRKT